MRATLSLLALLAFLCSPKSYAQTEPPPLAPGARPSGPQQPVQQYRVEDGGTREVLESIVIPPKANAPFSLLLQTEWSKLCLTVEPSLPKINAASPATLAAVSIRSAGF
jgi:hypothetical protein